jgi:CRP-like cAMP-binding protein
LDGRGIELAVNANPSITVTENSANSVEQRFVGGRSVLNLILAALPADEFAAIDPHLEYQEFPFMRALNEPDRSIENIYFLNSGLASLEVPMSEGRSIEVGVVGRGGFVGIPLLCGIERTLLRTVVQIPGSGFRLRGEDLGRLINSTPQLQVRMRHYALLQGMQIAQNAACNRLHELEQRLARWLLSTADRVGPEFSITQEHLAQMLGTGRASLSVVASRIRKAGVIHYARGVMRIINRPRLEGFACECYQAFRQFNNEVGLPL